MNVIKSDSITIYPFVKDGLYQSYGLQKATVINNLGKKANILHRAHKDDSWSTVQMQMSKEQFQLYINELQKVCDELQENK